LRSKKLAKYIGRKVIETIVAVVRFKNFTISLVSRTLATIKAFVKRKWEEFRRWRARIAEARRRRIKQAKTWSERKFDQLCAILYRIFNPIRLFIWGILKAVRGFVWKWLNIIWKTFTWAFDKFIIGPPRALMWFLWGEWVEHLWLLFRTTFSIVLVIFGVVIIIIIALFIQNLGQWNLLEDFLEEIGLTGNSTDTTDDDSQVDDDDSQVDEGPDIDYATLFLYIFYAFAIVVLVITVVRSKYFKWFRTGFVVWIFEPTKRCVTAFAKGTKKNIIDPPVNGAKWTNKNVLQVSRDDRVAKLQIVVFRDI